MEPGPTTLTPDQQQFAAKRLAAEHGFPLSGIAAVPCDGRAPQAEALQDWLHRNLQGPLQYMLRTQHTRASLSGRFPWATSILSLGAFYSGTQTSGVAEHVARYAQGSDYHRIVDKRLRKLARALRAAGVCHRAHCYVDTGPVLERAWAQRAGLGWIGKNTCLIHPRLGSYLLLAEVIMDSQPTPDGPGVNHCGSCLRCLQACPTQALIQPGVLDAKRCLSTWNIEARGTTPQVFWSAQKKWIFGCDICQEVCPFNSPGRVAPPDDELVGAQPWHTLTLADCIDLDEPRFQTLFARTPLKRTGCTALRLSAITAAGNLKVKACAAALQRCLSDREAAIKARAEWALAEMHSPEL